MKNHNQTIGFKKLDLKYRSQQGWFGRLFFWMFRPRINSFAKSVLSAGFERVIVNSQQFHELAAIVDNRLFPEYSEPAWPRGTVVQENIQCGGDCAGGDINK